MNKIIGRLLVLFLIPLFFIFQPLSAYAQTTVDWENVPGHSVAAKNACVMDGDVATIQGFECLFYNVLQIIVTIAGFAFLIMFIYGGYQYLFSGNDPKKTAVASSTLTMAIIGVVGLIASWLILTLIHNFTGVNVTNFIIPGWE
jgi:hypothetical protein